MITTEPVIIMSLECIQPESSQFGHDWVGGESPVGVAGGCDGGAGGGGAWLHDLLLLGLFPGLQLRGLLPAQQVGPSQLPLCRNIRPVWSRSALGPAQSFLRREHQAGGGEDWGGEHRGAEGQPAERTGLQTPLLSHHHLLSSNLSKLLPQKLWPARTVSLYWNKIDSAKTLRHFVFQYNNQYQ